MKNYKFILLCFTAAFVVLSGCSISNQSMKSPNYHLEFYKADFEYSKQVTAEATSVKVLCIDWKRLFKWESGEIESDLTKSENQSQNIALSTSFLTNSSIGGLSTVIPVIGDYGKGQVCSYALYKLMQENPGYDIVIYPQYETRSFIIPLFYSKRTVKVTARLGKIK